MLLWMMTIYISSSEPWMIVMIWIVCCYDFISIITIYHLVSSSVVIVVDVYQSDYQLLRYSTIVIDIQYNCLHLLMTTYCLSGWWFGTFFIFPYIGNNHPNWLIFFRGVQTTNQLLFIDDSHYPWYFTIFNVFFHGSLHCFAGGWRQQRRHPVAVHRVAAGWHAIAGGSGGSGADHPWGLLLCIKPLVYMSYIPYHPINTPYYPINTIKIAIKWMGYY